MTALLHVFDVPAHSEMVSLSGHSDDVLLASATELVELDDETTEVGTDLAYGWIVTLPYGQTVRVAAEYSQFETWALTIVQLDEYDIVPELEAIIGQSPDCKYSPALHMRVPAHTRVETWWR